MTAKDRYTRTDGTIDVERAMRDGRGLQAGEALRLLRAALSGAARGKAALRAFLGSGEIAGHRR